MTACVLDTSVAVAWYLDESFAHAAREWQARLLTGEVELCVPGLHYWELGNVLRNRVRRGELEPGLAREVFDVHLEAPLRVIEPERTDVLRRALEYEATVYDAVYIELCLALDVGLVTAERATTPWVKKLGRRARLVG